MTQTAFRSHLLGVAIALSLCQAAVAQTETVLHRFTGGWDGAVSSASLIADAEGNLYGTAAFGGDLSCTTFPPPGCGTVFELIPQASGGWKMRTLYQFHGGFDGANPYGGLVFDDGGNLYGTTGYGGIGLGDGTVFELTRSADDRWHETVLHRFHRRDGSLPFSSLVFDSKGNLYGTTAYGGHWGCTYYGNVVPGCGTVFELIHSKSGWKEKILHIFTGMDGALAYDGVTFDNAGNLNGVTFEGGTGGGLQGGGVVFRLTPSGKDWTESTIYNFSGDFGRPVGPIRADNAGNLFGATKFDGIYGAGSVFQLSPSGSTWNLTTLYSFTGGADGLFPLAGIVRDASGNIYGTTGGASGGQCVANCGGVYRLDKSNGWAETELHCFSGGSDGIDPWASLLLDEDQNLYGTTYAGGDSNCAGAYGTGGGCGIVFKITP
jgi:hypothetical protein